MTFYSLSFYYHPMEGDGYKTKESKNFKEGNSMIISHGKKLSAIEVGTAGLSHDGSSTLLCNGAVKRKPYRFSRIVLHVLIGQSILTLHVDDLSPEVEERYKELRRRLREQHIVPIHVQSILISAYSHETLHGLKLSCDSFQLISDKEA